MAVPKYDDLFNPVLAAIKRLGGSASIIEMDEEVTRSLSLSEEDVAQPHGNRGTELQYRLAWARTYLKAFGLLNNTERGVWVLTPKGQEVGQVHPANVVRHLQSLHRERRNHRTHEIAEAQSQHESVEIAEAVLEEEWRESLLGHLLRLSPAAFERLCQRLLRESGFVEVRVTGRSGDGGIDGVGIVRIGGLLGFPVLFQCKRYQDRVGPGVIRDFRGAMIGRADRGLVITTGTFTREAKYEATRDGAPPIDIVDGEQLLDKLKDLRLGVSVRLIEEVSIVASFFNEI